MKCKVNLNNIGSIREMSGYIVAVSKKKKKTKLWKQQRRDATAARNTIKASLIL